MNRRPKIALTAGCPKGVGPEIVRSALEKLRDSCNITVYGDPVIAAGAPMLSGREAGEYSFKNLEAATEAVIRGEHDALVTAPINKHYWHLAGVPFTGHTEYLADKTGVREYAMMMASPRLRVTLATIHEAVRNIPLKLTPEKIVAAGRLTHAALQRHFGVAYPRIAVTGLNPHCGDSGLFGDEEEKIIRPSIEELTRRGVRASGPHPADTIFAQAAKGEYDAVIAMYHDQGLAAVKTLDYSSTVNITLGLPFIRTSPDHGTAEEIAGKGLADDTSLITAIGMAIDTVKSCHEKLRDL